MVRHRELHALAAGVGAAHVVHLDVPHRRMRALVELDPRAASLKTHMADDGCKGVDAMDAIAISPGELARISATVLQACAAEMHEGGHHLDALDANVVAVLEEDSDARRRVDDPYLRQYESSATRAIRHSRTPPQPLFGI